MSTRAWMIAAAIGAASLAYLACDSDGSAVKEENPGADAGPSGTDGGPNGTDGGDGGPSDCFTNPQTHYEIINACTDAVKIPKNPKLPLQYPDGGLPPLP